MFPSAARAAALSGLVLAFGGALLALAPLTSFAFAPDQVARGEEIWNNVCARCHAAGSDNPDAPKLLEPPPIKSFTSAAGMFQYVQESMPNDEPMTLSQEQYWDVVAFILAKKGVSIGETPLGPENAPNTPVQAP
jgi:mono/diheme cytochrome c family protein